MSKAYLEIAGKKFSGYELILRRDANAPLPGHDIIVSESVLNRLRTLDGLVDQGYVPEDGASIHVVPDCPIAMDDIRKNYRIKRSLDGGECNVFSPYTKNRLWCRCANTTAIIPSMKAIICDTRYGADRDSMNELIKASLPQAGSLKEEDVIYVADRIFLVGLRINEGYTRLLDGTLTRPAVSYRNLRINSGNHLTPDALFLTYQAGTRWRNETDAVKNFILQASALNQCNWRDYPGTISLLMNELLQRHGSAKDEVCSIRSRQPKAIRELLAMKPAEFAGKEDMRMASTLLKYVLDLHEERFSSLDTLRNKLNKTGVSPVTMNRFFNTMVRIQPIDYD